MKSKFTHVLLAGMLTVWVGLGTPAAFAQTLRPEAQAGVLLSQARESMKSERWKEARESLEKILAIDIELPVTFHYQYALTLHQTGAFDKSMERLSLYLNSDDAQADEFYNDALRLFNDSQAALARQKAAEEQQRQAAVERARQLAAAEEAARQKALADLRAKQAAAEKATREAEERARKIAEDKRLYALYFKNGQEAESRKDYRLAAVEYAKAVNRANPFPAQRVDAALRLANLYATGYGVTKDEWKAVGVLRPFIANGEANAEIYYQAGQHLKAGFYRTGGLGKFSLTTYDGRNFVDNMGVADVYRKAHEKGHPKALGEVESLFNFIHAQIIKMPHSERQSYNGTSAYIDIAWLIADYNKTKGHYFVGLTYLHFYKNRTKARDYFASSADLGNAEARARLIELCLTLGQEHEETMRNARPRGNKENWKEKAIFEYQIAARHGSEEAAKRLRRLR